MVMTRGASTVPTSAERDVIREKVDLDSDVKSVKSRDALEVVQSLQTQVTKRKAVRKHVDDQHSKKAKCFFGKNPFLLETEASFMPLMSEKEVQADDCAHGLSSQRTNASMNKEVAPGIKAENDAAEEIIVQATHRSRGRGKRPPSHE